MKKTYMDVVANAFGELKAWRTATFIFAALCAFLGFSLVKQAANAPTYLVPYELATTAKKPGEPLNKGLAIKVQPGSFSADYLQLVATADLNLVLNWTPKTIEAQYGRFFSRMTPELYKTQNIQLMEEMQKFASGSTTQSFYPGSVRLHEQTLALEVSGVLVRWVGEKEVFRQNVTYTISYKESGGMLYVDNLAIKG